MNYPSLCLLILAFNYAPAIQAHDHRDGHKKVMGDVHIEADAVTDDVSTVNGDITLEENAEVGAARTTNGSIRTAAGVSADKLVTVNGSIHGGERLVVEHHVSTVNGSIHLLPGSRIGGDVTTVNGSIQLRETRTAGDLVTTNGNIQLAQSTIEGDLVFRETRSWGNPSTPKLTIDADSEVMGTIYLHQPVDLSISDAARINDIRRTYE